MQHMVFQPIANMVQSFSDMRQVFFAPGVHSFKIFNI